MQLLAAIRRAEIGSVAWETMSGAARGALDARVAAVIATLLRVVAALDEGALRAEDALLEAELRGLLMHGLPPRTQAEWDRLRAIFSPEAVREVERWASPARLLEGDALDGVKPGFFRDE
jgi:hypothetical protein